MSVKLLQQLYASFTKTLRAERVNLPLQTFTRRGKFENNFESLEMLQSVVFQIFCIIYSCILFTAHNNLPDVMLTTNTFT